MINKLVMGAVLVGATLTAVAQPAKPAVDYSVLAEKLVGKTANVKEGDIVLVQGGPNDLGLLEDIAVAVRKRGAHAIIEYSSESLAKKMVTALPEKYDGKAPAGALGLAKLVNVIISIPAVGDPTIWAAIPAARRATMAKAEAAVGDTQRKRNVRIVEIGNGLTPSPWRAKMFGVKEADLSKLFWDGVNADYTAVEEKAKALKATLSAGNELRITAPNGTDIKMKVKARKVLTSDGVLSDADVKAGGSNVQVWLPAGEVYVTPVPGTAEGKLVDDRLLIDGKEVTALTVEIKAGKITSITGTGWDAAKGVYDAAGPGKLELSVIDIGINPAVKSTAKLESYVAAGTITVAFGNNLWAGGTNKEPFNLPTFLTNGTLTLDGKPLVEAGALK